MDTEEIIAHVAQGPLTPRNPTLRRVSDPLKYYLGRIVVRQKVIDKEMLPLQQAVRDIPEEQRQGVDDLLKLSNENYALSRERDLLPRAIPLIEAYRQQGRRLRSDRDRAFEFIGELRRKLHNLELFGFGPVLEPPEDHWPENEGDEGLRELGGG